jgi:hypothetical protein
VKERHGRRKEPAEEHDDLSESAFGEHQRSDEPNDEDGYRANIVRARRRYPADDVVRDVS